MSEADRLHREEDWEDLFENAPTGYVSTRPDGTVIRANRTFLGWMGLRAEDVVGRRRLHDLLTPGGRIFYETHYAPLLRMQGQVREIAVDFVGADDRLVPALINAVTRTDEHGDLLAIRIGVFRATDRRGYERELLRARQRAEESEARSRSLAQTLQATFIPPAPPAISGLDVGAMYRPAGSGEEVGGDFYDVFQTGRDRWSVVVGDVCGKGAEAATVTALARYTLRAAAMRSRRPEVVLRTLNEALLRSSSDRFCTVSYGSLTKRQEGWRLTLASGGHPPPLRASYDEEVRALDSRGTVLGVIEDAELHDSFIDLHPGDVVVFYTDGVTEARGGDDWFGEKRLRALIERYRGEDAAVIAANVVEQVLEFQAGDARDDVVVVVVKVPAA